EAFATQAAIAIENARLFQTVTESRDRLQAVLNSTREGVLVVDSAGRIALANPRIEELWQIKRAELIDHNLADLVRRPALGIPEKLGFTTGELLELLINLSQGLAATTPKHIYRLEGPAPHFFERSGTPVHDEHLRVIGWVIVLRDVTEEKQVEEVREELTGMIVHDLRSPMTSVLGSLRLIEDIFVPRDDTGMLKEAVDVSSRASRKMLMLVDSLLDISKEEAGAMTLEQKPLNIRSIADSIVNDMGPMASLQSIQLIDEMPADLPLLMIDRDKVERVFTNLIDNALKFTPEDGQIILRASLSNHVPDGVDAEDRYMLCEVLDSGPGIPEEYRERIFDRFAQVRGREGRRRGSGLGLAFCRMVVEAHGGKIWAQDRPEGGSVFKFTLPVVKEQN
ncbi:MAG: ATP-binding protein, partial [Chloroflexota bacterium]